MRLACLQTPAFALEQAPEAARYLLAAVEGALASAPDLILLPEVAYPAYYLPGVDSAAALDERLAAMGAPTTADFAAMLAAVARRASVHIAAGIALAGPDGRLQNAMLLLDRQGRETLRAAKQFLWHFDACWFAPGDPPPVVSIDGVPTGLFICCDGRAPEIPRRLAVAGARLLLDATNWVATGRDPGNLPNAQPDYMMRVRAMENTTWFAAANKVGREADSIAYCGKSCVISPDGTVLAMAAGDRPETLVVDLPDGLPVPEGGLLGLRRPGYYPRMAQPGNWAPPAGAAASAPFVAALQVGREDPSDLIRHMTIQGADLIVLPESDLPFESLVHLSGLTEALIVATGREKRQTVTWLLQGDRLLGRYAKGHLSKADRAAGLIAGRKEPPVFETPAGRVGLMIGEDGLVPEVARGLALAGADLIAWPHRLNQPWVEAFARTRAAENRVFVAAACPAQPGGESMVVDPAGLPLARTFPGARQGVGAYSFLCVARHKEIIPGTTALGVRRYPELA